jgi:patatin-like phospholipase/acyl hydrolase
MKKLLSIDGGGIFGAGVAAWLKILNRDFDAFAGTSVGSIIASWLACGKSIDDLNAMFETCSKDMFKKPGFPQCLNPLRPAKYTNEGAKKILDEVFGSLLIKDVPKPLFIVAWNYEKKKEKIFSQKYNSDVRVQDAVLASMSAPSYFPICELNGEQLGDGGVCANDPVLIGGAGLMDMGVAQGDLKILSLATGGSATVKKISVKTLVGWLPVITDVVTRGNVAYAAFVAEQFCKSYMRICPDIVDCAMDDLDQQERIVSDWSSVPVEACREFLDK